MFFFQAEDGIRDIGVTGVQTCALPIYGRGRRDRGRPAAGSSRESARGAHSGIPGPRARALTFDSTLVNLGEVVYGCLESDRKSVVQGKSVDLGGRRIINKKNLHSKYGV